jgi:hypothetical protein
MLADRSFCMPVCLPRRKAAIFGIDVAVGDDDSGNDKCRENSNVSCFFKSSKLLLCEEEGV